MKEVETSLSVFEVSTQGSDAVKKLSSSNLLSGSQVVKEVMNEVSVRSKSLEVEKRLDVKQNEGEGSISRKLLENKIFVGILHDKEKLVSLFELVHASGVYNFQGCKIPVSNLNMVLWRKRLELYGDRIVCEFLEFGFPLDFDKNVKLTFGGKRNHKGARDFPSFINKYLRRECNAARSAGPFKKNPLSVPLAVSPMNTVPKASLDERRVIVDLSWPLGSSVNDGISKDMYLGEVIDLHYTSVEEVCEMVMKIGKGAVIYKRDLRHAYRQIPVDPSDYQYLGYYWEDDLYFDTVLAMGQRNAAMACTRTTNAVMYMHQVDGYAGTNYLDDLIGVAAADVGDQAYDSLGQLLEYLGLFENLEKACPPACVQLVLGVVVNTIDGTISVPNDRLTEIITLVEEWQIKTKTNKVDLQSLIGKLQFVTKCVRQSRIFLNRLLETLRSMSSTNSIRLSKSFKKDLRWWFLFVEQFNGVSYIPPLGWEEPDVAFSTDSCLKGCGGVCDNEYFHASFPQFIQDQDLGIHALEMLAVLVGVRIWGHKCEGMKIRIYCDNEAAVRVINSSKTKDSFLGSCLRELWLEVSKFGFQLQAVHLPGEENRVADWLSRWDFGDVYRNAFMGFISDDPSKYSEVYIPSHLFEFSREL